MGRMLIFFKGQEGECGKYIILLSLSSGILVKLLLIEIVIIIFLYILQMCS